MSWHALSSAVVSWYVSQPYRVCSTQLKLPVDIRLGIIKVRPRIYPNFRICYGKSWNLIDSRSWKWHQSFLKATKLHVVDWIHFLKDISCFVGFLEGVKPRSLQEKQLKEFTLLELLKPASHGGAYLGAKEAGMPMEVDYNLNAKIFYHFP